MCHSEPGAWHAPWPRYETKRCPSIGSKYNIGRTMFETDKIPTDWSDRLNFMDEVWVPTEHSRGIFEAYGVEKEKLHVVGEAVDTSFFKPQNISNIGIDIGIEYNSSDEFIGNEDEEARNAVKYIKSRAVEGTFIVLFVGKWEERKGIKLLISSFYEEFNDVDDVLLVMLTSAYHSTNCFGDKTKDVLLKLEEELISTSHHKSSDKREDMKIRNKMKKALENTPVTRLIFSDLPQRDLPSLYSLSNVLVSLNYVYCFFVLLFFSYPFFFFFSRL